MPIRRSPMPKCFHSVSTVDCFLRENQKKKPLTAKKLARANPAVTCILVVPRCSSDMPPLKFKVGEGAGAVSSVSWMVGGAGGLLIVGAGAGT